MIPLPQRITTIELKSGSVALAATADKFYLVGLDYSPGLLVTTWNPTTDYFASRDLVAARKAFYEYAGITPRTDDPRRLESGFDVKPGGLR
jgi:hypothetical protein